MAPPSEVGLRLALAGGGTGGHVLPGRHLLAHLVVGGGLADLLWLGTGREAEERGLAGLAASLGGAPSEVVRLALEPRGGGAPSTASLALRALPAAWTARRALRRHASRVLLGLGGFPCLPAVLAARSLGIPVLLLETNAVPGRATRTLARFARRVACAWPLEAAAGAAAAVRGAVHVGPPLAPELTRGEPSETERAAAVRDLGFDPARPLLLVLGGSQGAGGLNAFVRDEARALVAGGLAVLHQVGPGRLAEGAGELPGYRAVEYLDPVHRALVAATVVLCRGGAATVAEVAALRRPALIVPYPHHADRQQEHNARQLGAGATIVAEAELGPPVREQLLALAGAGEHDAREAAAERARRSAALARAVPLDGAERLIALLAEAAASAPRRGARSAS